MRSLLWPALGCTLVTAAQASTPTASVEKPQQQKKEEILTVTARFIAEAEKKIPFTVNYLDNVALENRQIKSGQSLLWQTPGLALNTDGQNPESAIKIRGVGAINQVSSDDTSVVTALNGVPVPKGNITNRLLDIAEVNILKGPQGTLFGRNSEAGVINVIPNKPDNTFKGHIGGEVGTRHHAVSEMVINAPLTDTLSSRIALQYDQQDAQMRNDQDGGNPVSRPRNIIGRESLRWQPTEQDDLLFTLDHQRQRHNAVGMTVLDKSARMSLPKGSFNNWENNTTLSFNWHHSWDKARLTNVTSWGDYEHYTSGASDDRINQRLYGKTYNSWRMFSNHQKQFFQELRLGSTEESAFFWVAGINYLRSDRTHYSDGGWNERPGWDTDFMNANINRNFTNNSFALFGESTVPLTDRLDLTTGLRHTWEKLDYLAHWTAKPGYAKPGPKSSSDHQTLYDSYFTGRTGLNYALTDNWNVYAMYSRGQKSRGFGDWDSSIASGHPSTPYKAAKINSYEIGSKATIPSLNLEMNQALFYNDTRDDHYYAMLNPSQSFASVTENFDTQSKGVELSAKWRPGTEVTLQAGVDYTLASITRLPDDSQSGGRKGNRVPDVPRWGASFTTDYSHPMYIADLSVVFNTSLNYRYSSQREADIGNNFKLGETHLINTRMGLKSVYGDVYLWATNLLNNRSPVYGYYFPAVAQTDGGTGQDAHIGAVREGRVVGMSYYYYF